MPAPPLLRRYQCHFRRCRRCCCALAADVLPSVLAVREPPSADCRDAASAAAQRCLLTVRRRWNPRRPRWPRSCPVRSLPFRYYARCRLSDRVCTTPSSFLQLGRAWLRFPGRPVVSPTRRSTDPPPFRWIHPFLMPRLGAPHHPVKTDTHRRHPRSPQDHPPTWSTPDPSRHLLQADAPWATGTT